MTVASTSRPGAFLRSLGALAVACLAATAGQGQSVKLSGALAQPIGGNAGLFAITPDGSHVVYRGDQEVDERYELYVVPSDGSQPPIKISDPLHGNVHGTAGLVTPDGSAVVYLTETLALLRAPLDGSSAPLQLAGGLALDLDQLSYDEPFRMELSPDGLWLLYRENDPPQLRAVRVDGSAPPVAIGSAAAVIPRDFRLAPDGQRVVYRAGISDIKQALYSAPIDGSAAPTRLNPGYFDARQTVGGFFVSPDSTRVVYTSDQDVPEVFESYVVPIAGGPSTGLNGTLPAHADAHAVAITPDSTRVLFEVDLVVNERFDLYVTPIDASAAPLRLSGIPPSIWPNGVLGVRLSQDGGRVVYLTSGRELYSVPITGGPSLRLSQAGAVVTDYEVTPDGIVPFQAYHADDRIDLFSVPVDGGYRGRITRAPRIRRLAVDVHNHFSLHPDGQTVLFLSHIPDGLYRVPVNGDGPAVELYPQYTGYAPLPGNHVVIAPLTPLQFPGTNLYSLTLVPPGPPVRLNTDLPLGPVLGRIKTFETSPDGQWAAYIAEGELRFQHELYVSPTDGSAPPRKVSAGGGDAGGYDPQPGSIRFTHDSTRIVYVADHDVTNTLDLYLVPVDGSAAPDRLTAISDFYGVRAGFQLTPEGEHAVFLAQVPAGPTSSETRLFSVRLDGSAPPFALSASPEDLYSGVQSFAVSPDSTRVVYESDEQAYHHYQLLSVPLEGGPIVALQPSAGYTADVFDYAFTPDGAHVVYLFRGGLPSSVTQLYSIPSDGSSPRTSFGPAGSFEVTPDGLGLVYLRGVPGVVGGYALWLSPLDASSALVLNPPNAPGPYGIGVSYRITPDGTRLVVLADQEVDGVPMLFSLPLDGSQQVTHLSQPIPGGATIWYEFVLSPDGTRVLYFTDAAAPGRHELHSVPVAGGVAPVRLNGSIVAGGGFALTFPQPLPIAVSGRRVAYTLDQHQVGLDELFVVPIDGSQEARKVNEPLLGSPSATLPFAFAGQDTLVYLAPQDLPGVPELFARTKASVHHHLPR
ncbi:MAG TPA: hypothetical protein VF530_12145 [Planctomycetota bacterium]